MKTLWLLVALTGCGLLGGPPVRYVVGTPYQSGGVWRYPREDFARVETGLAAVYPGGGLFAFARRTANGERLDPGAMAAGHPTSQLPAIALITNLDNGRQLRVRINDRGPTAPTRALLVTRRVATLLQASDPAAIRVRVEVLEMESRQLAGTLAPDTVAVAITAAPAGGVSAESLAPPPGATQSGRVKSASGGPARPAEVPVQTIPPVPLRLAETVTQTSASPGALMISCGAFSSAEYAGLLRARLADLGAQIVTRYAAARSAAYVVQLGPFATVADADAMLPRVLAAGAPDARIVIE